LAYQLVGLIAEHPKEVHHLAIQVVISFNWSRFTIEQNRSRTTERLTVVVSGW